MNLSCRLRRGRSARNRPRTALILSRRKECLQAEQGKRTVDQAIQPALRKTEIFEERRCFLVIELGDLLFEARRYCHHLRARTCSILLHLLHVRILRVRCRRLILANVRDVEDRLAREEIQITQDPLLLLGELRLARRLPRIERLFQALQCRMLRLCLFAPRFQQFRHLG